MTTQGDLLRNLIPVRVVESVTACCCSECAEIGDIPVVIIDPGEPWLIWTEDQSTITLKHVSGRQLRFRAREWSDYYIKIFECI